MPRLIRTFLNFAFGELTPRLKGRVDLPIYNQGCESLENFSIDSKGAAIYRNGSKMIGRNRFNTTEDIRLIPFVEDDDNKYIMAVGPVARIFKNQNAVFKSSENFAITAIAKGATTTITVVGSPAYGTNDNVYINGVLGMREINGGPYEVVSSAVNTIILALDSTNFPDFLAGGSPTIDLQFGLASFIDVSTLSILKHAQSANTMYWTEGLLGPIKVTRTADDAWTIAAAVLTANPFVGIGNHPLAVSFYEQRIFYLGTPNNPTKIFGSVADSVDDFTTGTAAGDSFVYTMSANRAGEIFWGESSELSLVMGTEGGIFRVSGTRPEEAITPTNISIRRLNSTRCQNVLPATKSKFIAFIQSGGEILRTFEFDLSVDGFNAVNLTKLADHILKNKVIDLTSQTKTDAEILWCVLADGNMVGVTLDRSENVVGWFRVTKRSTDKYKFVTNIPGPAGDDELWVVVERSINGSLVKFVELFDTEVVFPERKDFFTNDEDADDETFGLAIFDKQIESLHLDCSTTFDGTQAGTDASATVTPAAVSGDSVVFTASSAVFRSEDVGRQIWAKGKKGRAEIITFTNSTTVTCKILQNFNSTLAIAIGSWFLTSNSIENLQYLEGEIVQIIVDGMVHDDKTVTDGAVALDFEGGVVHVGFGYTGQLKTMPLDIDAGSPTHHFLKNISRVTLRFLNSLGAKFGSDVYDMEQINFRDNQSLFDKPMQPFTGDKEVNANSDWNSIKSVIVKQEVALPCIIQMVRAHLDTSDNE